MVRIYIGRSYSYAGKHWNVINHTKASAGETEKVHIQRISSDEDFLIEATEFRQKALYLVSR